MKRLAEWCLVVSAAAALAACSDRSINFSEPTDGPPVRALGSFQYCRMFTNPPVLMWTAPSTYGAQCPVQLTATPRGSFHVGDAALTYVFNSPVVDLSVDANRGFNAPCPTTPMTYTSYRQDGTIITQGQFTTFCNGTNESIDGAWIMDGTNEPVKKLVVTAPVPMVGWNGTDFAIDIGIKYNVICPPTGDPVVDQQQVRDEFWDALQASNWQSTNDLQRKETGGIIYRLPDGTYFAQRITDPNASACSYLSSRGVIPPPPAGAVAVAGYHIHPNQKGATLTYAACPEQLKPGEIGTTPDPTLNGGSDNWDWDNTTLSGFPEYVINTAGQINRLNPGTALADRPNNPNRYSFSTSLKNTCPARII